MNFMAAAGGKYPPGTTFPNHVMLGVKGDDSAQGKYLGLRVTEIAPDSAAAKAAIQPGDIVLRVARKRFKNMDDYLDATAEAAEAPTYDVEILRGTKTMVLKLERAFRPPFAEIVEALPPGNEPPTIQASQSVADELRKFAKLKEDGLITEAEFEAQKRKLLGQ
jgi:membrane-associated protease RseP (regulator of RpoE activity)